MGKVFARKPTHIVSALLLLLALAFYPFPFVLYPDSLSAHAEAGSSALVSTATPEGRLAVFDDVWARINDRYYDQRFHGLDWEAQRITFRTQAANAKSAPELYTVLRRMIASLNDPHTRVFSPEEKFDWWRPRFVTVGFALAEIEGLPTVIRVDPDSVAQRAGVRAGDVIETVNGEPAIDLLKIRLANLPDPASAVARFRVFAKLLDGPVETPLDITWKGRDGKRQSAQFQRYWQQRELGLRVSRERGDYAVVDLDAFTKPIATAFGRNVREKLKGARGVIIDLRTNGGGDAEAMSDIAATFLGIGVDLGQFTDRVGTSFTIFTQATSLLAINPFEQTKLPLIVLTSERTASAAEILVEALRLARRATIIGTQTCGCVLAVRNRHLLPDGGLLDVSELDYETAQGRRLEGHGIEPDERVSIERRDLYSHRDAVLVHALDKLQQR